MSTSFWFILIVGAIVSFVSIGPSGQSSPPPHAANKPAAVQNQIVLIAVDAIGVTAVMVFMLAGTIVGVVTGHRDPVKIHVVAKTFPTDLFVFSKNLLDLLELVFDSIDSIE
jgi:hypothetical protein